MFVIPAKAEIHFRLCLWPFARTSSLPTGEDTDAAIYICLIRSGFGRDAPSRESESNAKTKAKIIKWIPAFAGMTVVFLHRGVFSTAPSRGECFSLFHLTSLNLADRDFFNSPVGDAYMRPCFFAVGTRVACMRPLQNHHGSQGLFQRPRIGEAVLSRKRETPGTRPGVYFRTVYLS